VLDVLAVVRHRRTLERHWWACAAPVLSIALLHLLICACMHAPFVHSCADAWGVATGLARNVVLLASCWLLRLNYDKRRLVALHFLVLGRCLSPCGCPRPPQVFEVSKRGQLRAMLKQFALLQKPFLLDECDHVAGDGHHRSPASHQHAGPW
jgi:hypothetical protein